MINIMKFKKSQTPAQLFRYLILPFCISIILPADLMAKAAPQSMLELRKLALNFIQQHYSPKSGVHIEFARWDSRIKLKHCDSKKISAFFPGKQQRLGNVSVGLRCSEKSKWTLYLRAFVTMKQDIVHARRFISRGTVISKNDLVIDNIEISNSNTKFFHKPHNIIGKVAKRNIAIGRKISATALKPAIIIKRGQEVNIIAQTGGILIRTKGKALSDGAKGQIVKVKNNRSKRELQATVIAPNTVKVNM